MMFRSVESGRSNFIFAEMEEHAKFSFGIRIKMNDAPVCLPRIDPLAAIWRFDPATARHPKPGAGRSTNFLMKQNV